MIKTEIIEGKKISSELVKFWNKTMFDTFHSKPIKNFRKNVFFIVKDNKEIVALGRIILIDINYLGKSYEIFGFGDIASLEKGKGYGKILMSSMKKYSQKNKKTALGFCHNTRIPFYEKCGFKTKKKTTKKFFYLGKNKGEKKYARFYSRCNPVIIYLSGKDRFVEDILRNKQKAELPMQFW